MWACQAMPEALHPRSFRATFGHNTNLWARMGALPPFAKAGAEASLFPAGFNFSAEFFSPHGLGAGRRPCDSLPNAVVVPHRCPCRGDNVGGEDEECAELEALVRLLAREGRMEPAGPGSAPKARR